MTILFYNDKIALYADVVELADTLDLGSNALWCAGSSPVIRIKHYKVQGACSEGGSFFIKAGGFMKKMRIAGIVLIICGLVTIISAAVMHHTAEKRGDELVMAYMDYTAKLEEQSKEPTGEGATASAQSEQQTQAAPTIPEGVMGVMIIDKIDLTAPIVEGTKMKDIIYALGHFDGTAYPGETGNFAVAGHRSYSFGEYFSRLDELAAGDSVKVIYGKNTYNYIVDATYVVAPERVDVLNPTKDKCITLVTCTPKWTATHRLVVRGHLENG